MSEIPKKPKVLIFDWDNTLVDTWPAIHDAINHTLVAMGHEAWTFDETKVRVKKSMRDSFPELFGDQWEKAGEIFYARFEESHIAQLKAIDKTEETLKSLQDKGFILCVVSNKTGKYLREEIEHLGWGDFFHSIVGAGDAQADKPNPACVELALKDLPTTQPDEVWFIGDTDVDLECAINFGCSGILLRKIPPTKGEFDLHPPSCYFMSCTDLFNALNS